MIKKACYDKSSKLNVERESNFELLRIFSMSIIVLHHFSIYSGFSNGGENRAFILILSTCGEIGVNLYVMITGYYMIEKDTIKISKLLAIWLQMITYSLILFFLFVGSGIEEFSVRSFLHSVFPITCSLWWFMSTYLVLYLFIPFINVFLKSVAKLNYVLFLVLCLSIWSIVPSLLKNSWQGSNLVWFAFLYSLAAFLKLYIKDCSLIRWRWPIIVVLVSYMSVIGLDSITDKYATYLMRENRILVLGVTVSLFVIFWKIKKCSIKAVNVVASCTLGVYLIHEHPWVRNVIWSSIFQGAEFENSKCLPLYAVGVAITIYCFCMIVELIRRHCIERLYMKLLRKLDVLLNRLYYNKLKTIHM